MVSRNFQKLSQSNQQCSEDYNIIAYPIHNQNQYWIENLELDYEEINYKIRLNALIDNDLTTTILMMPKKIFNEMEEITKKMYTSVYDYFTSQQIYNYQKQKHETFTKIGIGAYATFYSVDEEHRQFFNCIPTVIPGTQKDYVVIGRLGMHYLYLYIDEDNDNTLVCNGNQILKFL